jgi:N-acetylglucosaminyldiphosphoundecaprenol N-acetyl-beta-D-mannosaminyltransferase
MNIFGIKITNTSSELFAEYIKDALKGSKKVKISKINTEFLQRAIKNRDFAKILNDSDLNIVDGRGVLWAARYLTLPISQYKIIRFIQSIWQMIYSGVAVVFRPGFISYPISEAIPGVDAFELVMRVAEKNQAGVFILGASELNLKLAINNLRIKFSKLNIAGFLNGYDFQNDHRIDPVAEINKTNAKILIVALGSPKQEMWISKNIDKLKNIVIAVGEGGTLDRIANPSQKSPRFINKIGLEWLWRTVLNKSKTDGRNRIQKLWNAVPLFIYQIVKWKIKNGQTRI